MNNCSLENVFNHFSLILLLFAPLSACDVLPCYFITKGENITCTKIKNMGVDPIDPVLFTVADPFYSLSSQHC